MISFNAPISQLANGMHTFYLRSKNEDGSWSQTMSRPFMKHRLPEDLNPEITYLEYFFDNDPGFGQATPIAVDAISPLEIAVNLPLEELDYGMHTLYVRSKDENGRWSIVMQRTFIMGNYPADPLKELVRAEYFIDEDPGQGNAEPVMFNPNNGIHEQQFDADLSGLEWGEHTLYVRTMDESGSWSITVAEPFDVEEPPIIAEFSADITEGSVPLTVQFTDETFVSEPDEWLWNFGDGNISTAQNPQHIYTDPGNYTVSLTATGPEGTDTEVKEDFITVLPPLYSLEYFFDVDPGYGNGNGVYAYSGNQGGFDFLVPVDDLDDGYHLLFVRVKDTSNIWTQTLTRSILKTRLPLDPSPDITAMEYFLDDDPGFGSGNSLPVAQSPVSVVDALVPLDGIEDGLHNIYVRSQDENGRWSETFVRPFLKSYVPGALADVTRLEYFIDTDPGTGNGSPVDIPDPQPGVERSFVVNLDGQVPGEHRLFVRAIDERGHWSIVYNQLIEVTATGAVHVVQLPKGWSGISSYIIPDDASVENIFAPVQNELVILQNFTGMYWPVAGVNTLSNWDDHSGYQVKMETAQQVTFSGTMQDNLTASLSSGWNYLPVLNACDNDAGELFSPIIGNLEIVKEVAGYGVYWPQFGINTLGMISPGKAYFVLVSEMVELNFPVCEILKGSPGTLPELTEKQNLSGLGISPTPLSHTIAFPPGTCEGFSDGDIITINNQQGICCGAAVYQKQNLVITAFGDDPITPEIDGMMIGDELSFSLLKAETGKIYPLGIDFSNEMPHDRYFANHGLSAIARVYSTGTDSGKDLSLSVNVHPNPSNGMFTVGLDNINVQTDWQVVNIHGVVIKTGSSNAAFTIDLTNYPRGIYYLEITPGGLQVTRKLVLK
jgi:PKD repeat protein